jgi:hypothetical protein
MKRRLRFIDDHRRFDYVLEHLACPSLADRWHAFGPTGVAWLKSTTDWWRGWHRYTCMNGRPVLGWHQSSILSRCPVSSRAGSCRRASGVPRPGLSSCAAVGAVPRRRGGEAHGALVLCVEEKGAHLGEHLCRCLRVEALLLLCVLFPLKGGGKSCKVQSRWCPVGTMGAK